MEFQSTKGIFQQIADTLSHRILEGKLPPGERVPSVRDLAAEFEVNRNTLLRTYSILEDAGIIVNKRGIGFFVADNAIELIMENEKKAFFANDLPDFMQKVKVLKISSSELQELIQILSNNENKP
ncbi:MAG: GntR family transcriptional regulator [Paludibacter sp.]|jgi:DNA-binding transcriptional regulator YhcF (GntR family)|nr:GntR family transcriptional regulator [Paludibacter sp.]